MVETRRQKALRATREATDDSINPPPKRPKTRPRAKAKVHKADPERTMSACSPSPASQSPPRSKLGLLYSNDGLLVDLQMPASRRPPARLRPPMVPDPINSVPRFLRPCRQSKKTDGTNTPASTTSQKQKFWKSMGFSAARSRCGSQKPFPYDGLGIRSQAEIESGCSSGHPTPGSTGSLGETLKASTS